MNKVLCVGAGGIGSWLVAELVRLRDLGQLPYDIEVADFDSVDIKNITQGQNYTQKDLLKNKAEALARRYCMSGVSRRIEHILIIDNPLVVLCVDNNPTREYVMTYCHENKIDFIDLRADGRLIYAKPKGKSLQEDLDTLDLKDTEAGGCQQPKDTKIGYIQNGNKIVAAIGSQMVLNHVRGLDNYKWVMNI